MNVKVQGKECESCKGKRESKGEFKRRIRKESSKGEFERRVRRRDPGKDRNRMKEKRRAGKVARQE